MECHSRRASRTPATCFPASRCSALAIARRRLCKSLWLAALMSSMVHICGAASSSTKKKRKLEPLCHQSFRVLEKCLGSDYEKLKVQCAGEYDRLQECLSKEWTHIDDAAGYKRPGGAFNRMRSCRHGIMMYNPLDWYIGRSLEVYGEWGERKVHMIQRIVKAGHVVVDIGAHVGSLTLPLSKMVGPTGRVTAFEPFYPSFQTLAANIGLNSLLNVEVRQAVVHDRFGKLFVNRDHLAFGMHDFFNFGSMGFQTFRIYNVSDDVERPSTLWDEYQVVPLDHMSFSRLDFVKVDAEAMEINVLEGAQRILKKFKPVIFIEYRNPWEKDSKVLEFLRKKMKYECVLLRIPIWNVENFRSHEEDIWSVKTKLVSFNLLCKHRWWEYPDIDDPVLELFDTAVDTDIEGLRTTPTADPFEAMAMGARAFSGSSTPDSADHSYGKDDIPQPPLHKHPPPKDLTLDELLGEVPSPQPAKRAQPTATRAQQKTAEELTLDELLASVPEDPPKKTHSKPSPQKTQKKAPEEMTLDELLADLPETKPAPAPKTKPQKAYEDMTLDELLNSVPESQPHPTKKTQAPPTSSKAKKQRSETSPPRSKTKAYEDMTLDELLDEVAPIKDQGSTSGRVKSKDEQTLDELLGPADPQRDAEADRALDELLGASGGQDMTLDELLGPEPTSARKNKDLSLDELLGQEPAKAKELTLDELLGESAPQKAATKKATKQKATKQKPSKKEPTATQKSKKKEPDVRVKYEPEMSIDEL